MFRQDVEELPRENEAAQCAASAQETDQGTAYNRLFLKSIGYGAKA